MTKSIPTPNQTKDDHVHRSSKHSIVRTSKVKSIPKLKCKVTWRCSWASRRWNDDGLCHWRGTRRGREANLVSLVNRFAIDLQRKWSVQRNPRSEMLNPDEALLFGRAFWSKTLTESWHNAGEWRHREFK